MDISLTPIEQIVLLSIVPNETGSFREQYTAEEIRTMVQPDKAFFKHEGVSQDGGSIQASPEAMEAFTKELTFTDEQAQLLSMAFKLTEKRSKPTEEGGSINPQIFSIYRKLQDAKD